MEKRIKSENKHNAFIKELRAKLVSKEEESSNTEDVDDELTKALQKKFDELFGPIDDD